MSQSSQNPTSSSASALTVPSLPPAPLGVSQNPTTIYQQIHDLSSKRIATLDYIRKVHNGNIHWYNTILFSRADIAKMPYFDARKLGRRATNCLLLGLSLPNVLESNATNPHEYLRALNGLLSEFESYQQIHPVDGALASSLSRARIPHMFKRSAHTSGKGRRTSSAAEVGMPMVSTDPLDPKTSGAALTTSSSMSLPSCDQDLLPGEEYLSLITPTLPFEPDFFETFASLCDLLVDCYTRVMELISSPLTVTAGLGESFAKVDARLRKVILAGVVKEFEDTSRSGAKAEFAGLGKVVLGGLA